MMLICLAPYSGPTSTCSFRFQIPVCVLNSELPASTRCHVVSQFNQGIYDVIVASDEKFLDENFGAAGAAGGSKGQKKRDHDKERSKRKKDKESGVARGIDFQYVSNVINFDFPLDVDSYVHRVGRTARGNNTGSALSVVSDKQVFDMFVYVDKWWRRR